ncbi:hypothetical protein [Streptomyces mirabilis]|uniref:hypothetical protein n=1 Tax=Streptomyces mirabilis TaxID=68239 RepID=UPI00365C7267
MRRSATSGKEDSSLIYDDALDVGDRLCHSGWDLPNGYEDVQGFLNTVLSLQDYRKGAHEIPDGTGGIPSGRSDDGAGHA